MLNGLINHTKRLEVACGNSFWAANIQEEKSRVGGSLTNSPLILPASFLI